MGQIRINNGLYEALGAEGAKRVVEMMRESALVEDDVEIVGDPSVPVPEMSEPVFGMTFAEGIIDSLQDDEMMAGFRIRLPIKIPSGPCRIACDAAAAAAAAKAAALTGPALAAALAAIAAAREECRRRC